jgi:hypothetical protein
LLVDSLLNARYGKAAAVAELVSTTGLQEILPNLDPALFYVGHKLPHDDTVVLVLDPLGFSLG